jgi:hypothetical protein
VRSSASTPRRHQVRTCAIAASRLDHRRNSARWTGAALGSLTCARHRARDRRARRKLHRAPTGEEIADKLGVSTDDLNDSLTEIGRSSIAARRALDSFERWDRSP